MTGLSPEQRCPVCGTLGRIVSSDEGTQHFAAAPSDDDLGAAWREAEEALPEGWVLDGVRRLYDEGRASNRWVARAVEPHDDDEWEGVIPLLIGEGPTPAAALRALAARLREAT